jgi:RNA polymerase sigma-70 factor, ECF subfamily
MTGRPEPDDAEVMAAAVHRPERFAAIFDRHAPHIQRYLVRRLGSQAADDVLAETFLVAFGKRATYDTARPDARPWLYGIATNLVAQYHRERGRELRLRAAAPAEPEEHCHADRVAAQVTAEAARALLGDALADLAAGDRDVLLLVAWENLTYDEVAEALSIPTGTVRSRLNRARRRLRATLTEETVHG